MKYKIVRRYDGFMGDVGESDSLDDAIQRATDEGNSNTADYDARVYIYLGDELVWEKEFPRGSRYSYKGD